MKIKTYQWFTVLALGLVLALLTACGGAKETPAAPEPTDVSTAAEAPAESEKTPAEAEAPAPTEEMPAEVEVPATPEETAETEAPVATEEVSGVETPAASEEAVEAEAPPATEEAATEAPAAPEDAQTVIFQSIGNLRSLKTYRSQVTIEKDGQTMETFYEYDLPDKFHIVTEFAEMVGIGNDVYTKMGDTWTKIPGAGTGDENMGTTIARVEIPKESIQEARFEGIEEIDGVPCQKYVYTTALEGSPSMEITTWIGPEDGLPHKIVTEPEPGMIVTQILYDFNADITIETPVE